MKIGEIINFFVIFENCLNLNKIFNFWREMEKRENKCSDIMGLQDCLIKCNFIEFFGGCIRRNKK